MTENSENLDVDEKFIKVKNDKHLCGTCMFLDSFSNASCTFVFITGRNIVEGIVKVKLEKNSKRGERVYSK